MLDDSHAILNNPSIKNLSNWAKIWTSARTYSSLPANWGYRPVTVFSYLLAWSVADGATWPFHLLKIIVFSLMCVCVYKIWRRLFAQINPAVVFVAVLLFAINPVHTQVISYLSAMSTLLAGFFVTLALYSYLVFRENGKFMSLAFSLICVFLAALSKEEGIVIAGLIPVTELYLRKLEGRRLWDLKWLWLCGQMALPGLLAVFLIAYMYEPETGVARGWVMPINYFMTQWRAYLRYIVMYFYSYDLNADNLEFGFASKFTEPKVLLSLALNLGFLIFGAIRFNKQPFILFMLIWFYVGILPASGFIPLAEPVNDHRAFIGYIVAGGLILFLLQYVFVKNQKLFGFVSIAILILYSVQTWKRAVVWQSVETLWADTVEKNPTSPRARNNLAVHYISKNQFADARRLINECILYGPQYFICYTNLAIIEAEAGHDKAAEEAYAKAVQFESTRFLSRYYWAQFLMRRGFLARPIKLLEEADQVALGDNLDVRLQLLALYKQSGLWEAAQRFWEDTVARNPGNEFLLSLRPLAK